MRPIDLLVNARHHLNKCQKAVAYVNEECFEAPDQTLLEITANVRASMAALEAWIDQRTASSARGST